jgi:ferric-dicitrate binding protein FerR (iron transport regulator)
MKYGLKIDSLLVKIREIESVNLEENYQQVQLRISRLRKKRRQVLMRAAAILAVPLAFAVYVLTSKADSTDPEMIVAVAETGQIRELVLPDSSRVILNAGSSLSYPSRFSENRRDVHLEGQAYFEVISSPDYPFYVNTDQDVSIYVYGTKFEVCAYPDESFVETKLEKGNVHVLFTKTETTCKLDPHQKITYNKAERAFRIEDIRDEEFSDWRNGLVFKDAPMEDILRAVSRYFNVRFDVKNLSGNQVRYTAKFTNGETLEDILQSLSLISHLSWKKTGTDVNDNQHINIVL